MQRIIDVPEDQVQELEQLAAEDRTSLDRLVQVAIGDYLALRRRESSDWGLRWDALVTDVGSRIPSDVTPEEIEADITVASDEVRAARAAARRTPDADAGSR